MRLTLGRQSVVEKGHYANGEEIRESVDTDPFIGSAHYTYHGEEHVLYNPATNDPIMSIVICDKGAVNDAVAFAREAFDRGPWSRMSVEERSHILMRFADLIEKNAKFLGTIEALNVGKLLKECIHTEAARAVQNIRFFAKEILNWKEREFGKDVTFLSRKGMMVSRTYHDPAGVVGIIVPWNSPLTLGTWNIAPALAAGNTVVLKPSPWAPLSLLQLGRLASKAGIPTGVLNIVPGNVEAGQALVSHPVVDRIAFTGSVNVGRTIQIENAKTRFAPILLELGGKGANIVCEDADVDFAVKGCLISALRSQGQSCVAGSRMLVHASLYDEFVKKLVGQVSALRVGNHMDNETDIGPLITKEHLSRVMVYVESGEREGARLLYGGKTPEDFNLKNGNFLMPTVFENVTPEMTIFKEEIFGPVITLTSFTTEKEVGVLANATRFGLSSNVWTHDDKKYERIARKLRVGMVWQNAHFLRDLNVPFGGQKESGVGRAGGRHSLEFFSDTQAVHKVHYLA
ncbi:hypothetical protein A2673_04200 [Candidatus Kaiserbacteria bacterium RIFCSPHIGHO2_01_FULL_50_13]|uniref:Aldehyde dehydrogenase domain-containing protein n=1 Tax=Candidatus Kaiserbacteria bacterium RIFCSPLOWO2_01_FULL_50_24 TaxID=1798507 RepID=A0A1F6EMZ2_9BACT|nr:MAG: hypothetical protein A2673_04200 [Candidatus Kaiserbacteria bacterium RIFCSPHIGHO2_01_FULL_50_13]OGG75010.1 MAG: hypothetical protein A3A34_02590 [Candidatus Kaiserbacteria bacterium RIFCSPLOWO2_01_FULL_50_24]OGG82060.1 MAG: hypothetical protein A3H74_04290 [Candidatus Kaiserbacteria bacterium RIFCSPLOWO2_02_FULL_51_13]